MSREDEARLADRLRTSDPSAFRELVEAYQRKVYGLAYEITRNHDDAEDVSQVAFMKIHRALGTLKPGYGLNTWIYQVVRNAALDHVRKRSAGAREAAASLSALPPSYEPPIRPPDPRKRPSRRACAAGSTRPWSTSPRGRGRPSSSATITASRSGRSRRPWASAWGP